MTQDTPKEKDAVQVAGRGVLYITFAKLWFMLTGWALVFGLPRIFKWASGGDADQGQVLFGAYKLVIMGVSFINNGIITGTIQAVSKFTSEDDTQADAVKRTALKVQGILGCSLSLVYIAFAGLIAGALQSPDLAYLMRLSAGIIAAYSIYAVFIGAFNGKRQFNRQALFDITYATIKTALIVGLAAAGFQVLGTVLGFLIASTLIMIAAAAVSGLGTDSGFPAKRYLRFAAVLIIYTFFLNLVMSIDLFLLKGLSSRLALADGISAEAASEIGKALAGKYGAAQGLAFIPYQAILSIAFVAFPLISKVTFMGDQEKTKQYIGNAMRFSAILIVGIATVFAALPSQSLGLIFQPEYQVASKALAVLTLGIAAYGLMVVGNTVLNGAGRPFKALGVVLATLIAVTAGVLLFIYRAGPNDDALTAAAAGSAAGMTVGMVLSGIVVYRQFGAFLPWRSAVRIVVASGIALFAGRMMPNLGKVVTLAECAAVFALYLVVLIVIREFKKQDAEQLRRIVFRKNRP